MIDAGRCVTSPLTRDLGAIASEIENGMLSRERAASVYKIVFDANGEIDEAATTAQRAAVRSNDVRTFRFCEERQRHDRVWSLDTRRKLSGHGMAAEPRLRSRLVGTIHNRLLANGQPVEEQELADAVADEMADLTGERARKELASS